MAESEVRPCELPDLLPEYEAVRRHTVSLCRTLSEEDCCAQSMPDASPAKWHLAHVTWFFETFILEQHERDFRPFHPAFRMLFNSYYNGIGDKHVRAQRGLLTRPSLDEVMAYRDDVDFRMGQLLSSRLSGAQAAVLEPLVTLGLHHEQQHQELLLTDIKHLLSTNPMMPAYDALRPLRQPVGASSGWQEFESGVAAIGHGGDGFCFDNELPRHRVFLESYALSKRLVTNGEFIEFIEDGGYEDPLRWLSEGWDWRCSQDLRHPFYWRRSGAWQEFSLRGLQPLDHNAPVNHLSYYEADAYARWRGARLPTEAEWENAANVAGDEIDDLFGSRWQWTSSSYAPYPGFRVADGAVGEYNGKFMVNQYVLRGSSSVTPPGHARPSYRNFFPASARWQFTGLRLARSV